MHCSRPAIALATTALAVWLIALAVSTNAAPSRTTLVFKEGFEGYTNTESLRGAWKNSTAELEVASPGGGKAMSHPGDKLSRRGKFSVLPDAAHHVVLSADFYDFATNFHKHVSLFLQNSNGQFLQMGLQAASVYALRMKGFGMTTNWIPFYKEPRQVEGWHRFRAELSPTNLVATLDLGADGKIDRTLDLPVTTPESPFTHVRVGSLAKEPSPGGPVLLDNIRVEVMPVEAPPAIGQTDLTLRSPAPATTNQILRNQPQQTLSTNLSSSSTADIRTPSSSINYQLVAWWIFGALAVIGVLLLILLLMLKRRVPPEAALVHVTRRPLALPENLSEPASADEDWRQRALAAEALATRQAQVLGEKIGPELTAFAKEALVQGLYSQRNALLESERRALVALAELEDRLAEKQLARPDRIEAYQKRIAELEKLLETRDEEVRELARASLRLVRERLEQEQGKSGPRLN